MLAFEVVVSDPKFYRISSNGTDKIPLDGNIGQVIETVDKGSKLFEYLGVGGMNTRGMGRMKVEMAKGAAQ